MHPTHYTIISKDLYRYAASMLQPHWQWHDQGPKCTVTTLPNWLRLDRGF
jgi:hypothetical protein